jgi:hypothetical protein
MSENPKPTVKWGPVEDCVYDEEDGALLSWVQRSLDGSGSKYGETARGRMKRMERWVNDADHLWGMRE